jgi:hypothetical protein
MPAEFIDSPPKPLRGSFYDSVIDAVSQAKITGSSESRSGNGKDVFLQKGAYEQDVIRDGRLGEKIEGPFRLDKGVPGRCKAAAQIISLPLILGNVYVNPPQSGKNPLHQGRSIYKTQNPIAEG